MALELAGFAFVDETVLLVALLCVAAVVVVITAPRFLDTLLVCTLELAL